MTAATLGSTDVNDHHLREAVRDSHYLLAYFSRTRVTVAPDKIQTFQKAVKTISSFGIADSAPTQPRPEAEAGDRTDKVAPLNPDKIAEFWSAFIFLSDLTYPATVESIRYYFRLYYDRGKHSAEHKRRGKRSRRGLLFPGAQSSFGILTSIALFMTVGLSLLSYIGTTALLGYDADYAHWTQVQTLVRYLDEGGKLSLTAGQTIDYRRLAVTPPASNPGVESAPSQPAVRPINIRHDSEAADGTYDSALEVPIAQVPRISNLLIDANLNDGPASPLQYACTPLLSLFAKARRTKLADPVPPGALTLAECMGLMANVKPHVLAVADDLAFTFSSMSAERATLHQILSIVLFPIRLFDEITSAPTWIYDSLHGAATSGIEQAHAAQRAPYPITQPDAPQLETEFAPNPSDAFNLLVLLQQRHAPIPIILPLPSVKTLGGVFDARVAVAITNTYLLTLAFGFLGACVRVLREIHNRLQDFTLAPSLFPRYRARILLGMVAGPTIGLFFSQGGHLLSFTTSSSNVPTLSTQFSALSMAFVAGFSIEILFAILDRCIRIIQEFTGVTDAPKPIPK